MRTPVIGALTGLGGSAITRRSMASESKKTKGKRRRRKNRMGRTRKNKLALASTLSNEELFAGFGEPGQPAPAAAN